MNNQLRTVDQMQANIGFVESQTAHIEAGVYAHRFPAIRYAGLIPVDNSAPEWIRTIDYFSMDVAGSAGWTADRSRDLNLVATEYGKASSTVHLADIGYDFGLQEVEVARSVGANLSGDKALAARMIYERFVDKIAFTGDAEKGWSGLFNNPSVTASGATTGDWSNSNTNEDQMLADVNELLSGVWTATNEIAMADTLLLPHTEIQRLGSTRLGDNGTLTVLEFIRNQNVYTAETGQPLTIRGIRGLEEAGVSGAKRMVAYRNSTEVMKMHIPMRHQFLPMQTVGLSFQVPGIFRLGGLEIRLPSEVRYSDGI